MSVNCLMILGPTASGKTKVAVELAHRLNGEIISMDSRQVYNELTIGTGKDLNEYHINGEKIHYHLIDILPPTERYHVYQFVTDFTNAFNSIIAKGKLPVLCGGTGLYFDTLLKKSQWIAVPVNPELRARLEKKNKDELLQILSPFPEEIKNQVDTTSVKRIIRGIEIATYLKDNSSPKINYPDLKPFTLGIDNGIEPRKNHILNRLKERLKGGMIEEASNLLQSGVSHEQMEYFGLEYKFLSRFLNNEISETEMEEQLYTAIVQFAKRQMTFFRKLEKDGLNIHWTNAAEATNEANLKQIADALKNER